MSCKHTNIANRRSNLDMYRILHDIQDSIARLPSKSLDDCIVLRDALGNEKLLPYAFFNHFEVASKSFSSRVFTLNPSTDISSRFSMLSCSPSSRACRDITTLTRETISLST